MDYSTASGGGIRVATLVLVLMLAYGVVCGFLGGYVASQKNRRGGVWFVVCLLTGILGLIAVAGLPVEPDPYAGSFKDV
jgi:hypothetical protein